MKQNNIHKKILYLIFALFGLLFFGCEDDEDQIDSIDRLFRPLSFESDVNGVDVYFSWIPIANASYVIEISKDSLEFTNDVQQIEISEDETDYTVTDLYSLTQYSARIKAVSLDNTTNDSKFSELAFKTTTENIFYEADMYGIGLNYITIQWNKEKTADKIVVTETATNTVIKTITLSDTDIESGELLIDGLNPETAYLIQILNGDNVRGNMSVSTASFNYDVYVNQTVVIEDFVLLGTYYLQAGKGAYIKMTNELTSGYLIADAFKFVKVGYDDVYSDSEDESTEYKALARSTGYSPYYGNNYGYTVGAGTAVSEPTRYITWYPELPVSGVYDVYIIYCGAANRCSNVHVHIYAGDN